jgi:hypothetical protein
MSQIPWGKGRIEHLSGPSWLVTQSRRNLQPAWERTLLWLPVEFKGSKGLGLPNLLHLRGLAR